MITLLLIAKGITIVLFALALVYATGVVWRVEMRLDTSYKFLWFSLLFALLGEISSWYSAIGNETVWTAVTVILRLLFAGSFFMSIFLMRSIVRNADGESERR